MYQMKFELVRAKGENDDYIELSDCYVIANGGWYILTGVFVSAFGNSSNPTEYKFSN